MRRIGRNSLTEIYFAGCNPGFVETSDGYVMIDSPQQPIDAVRWRGADGLMPHHPKWSSRGPLAHGLDPWGRPGPTDPPPERLKNRSRPAPG